MARIPNTVGTTFPRGKSQSGKVQHEHCALISAVIILVSALLISFYVITFPSAKPPILSQILSCHPSAYLRSFQAPIGPVRIGPFMDHWRNSSILPYQLNNETTRVLAVTSGNAQLSILDTQEGIENENPLPQEQSTSSVTKNERQYPTPGLTLGSNDHHEAKLAHLHARQQRRRYGSRRRQDPGRPYLHDPKYINYRARPRRDTGQDGKPVWDEAMEDAFQDALLSIEPMGRRKKAQHNKPYGRNELISEYIYQATGQFRTRKQVSSHIQVLNHLLKGIPEWDALIIAIDDKNPRNNNCYYENSIADMVRSNNPFSHAGSTRMHPEEGLARPTYTLRSNGESPDTYGLTALSFEMWVSLPNQMDSALHNYTRLQSTRFSAAPALLESIENWRSIYPNLSSIVDDWGERGKCDIIRLGASFQLMSDFPPRFSKLGISLELDFQHPSSSNLKALSELQQWSCITHMYQNGKLVKQAQYDDCHISSIGRVKPFFESKWWAATFTTITEKRRRAEDSKSEAAIQLASEQSRNFFRGLSVVQEIRAGPSKQDSSHGACSNTLQPQRRMAVLLWQFSQAQPNYVGTTTWQKLIPPPERTLTNSPLPSSPEMALPSLALDSMVDSGHDMPEFDDNHNFLVQHSQGGYPIYPDFIDTELCQDAFMTFKEDELASFAAMHESFGFTNAQVSGMMQVPESHNLHSINHFDVHVEAGNTQLQHSDQFRGLTSRDLIEAHHNQLQPVDSDHMQHGFQENFSTDSQGRRTPRESEESPPRRPLTSFDINTHKILQAQLSQDYDRMQQQSHEQTKAEQDQISQNHNLLQEETGEESLRAAPVAANTTSEIRSLPLDQHALADSIDHDSQRLSNNFTGFHRTPQQFGDQSPEHQWLAPIPTRPVFHSHASYLAQHPSDQYEEYDPSEHSDFYASALVTNLEAFDANDLSATLFADNASATHISRPELLETRSPQRLQVGSGAVGLEEENEQGKTL